MADSKEINIQEKLDLIIEGIREKKGKEITTINLQEIHNSICDYFVICQGNSGTQVDAIADSVEEKLRKEAGIRPHHVEGKDNSLWILMDYYDILVHIFLDEKRSFYNLEDLWADGKIEKLEDEL